MPYVAKRALREPLRQVEDQISARLRPGEAYPLGASYDEFGTNFSVFSEIAERVELCLFDDEGREERIDLKEVDGYCWHAYVSGVGPGQRYGYRIHGPWEPSRGLICNPNKLLLDPYAKAIEGEVKWHPSCFGHVIGDFDRRNDQDSAPYMPRSVVHQATFDWGDDRRPNTSLHETIIYEAHVKGLTMTHPSVPAELRGTYAGIAHDAVLEHLVSLGITAIELMPIHQFVQDGHLLNQGLRNYWGYNTIGFFAPHNEYAHAKNPGGQVREFKAMVKRLHQAGIEVILDVVYNHTAEGNHEGPMLSFKGIDNGAYYRLVPDNPRYYFDTTGTGNTLNMQHPYALQLVMDSLRYWVTEMHVDGFRFDLASALARDLYEVNRLAAFFELVQQDPIVSQVKLIAEPWDLGTGGYQVGNFPPHWSEWNGKYRDSVRDFWRGQDASLAEFASRFTGSSDLYQGDTRRPHASINFVTAHDGFTLADLVSYNEKHNEANHGGNCDGESENRSWNCGVEGPTDDPEVLALRAKQQRNFFTTLLLSQGVPMILYGDELGRSQGGNNNGYCQDNETTWIDWEGAATNIELFEFVRGMIALRKRHPVFRRRRWFQGRTIRGSAEIGWYRPDGSEMTDSDWETGFVKSVAVFLNGEARIETDERGRSYQDEPFLIVFNAHHEPLPWTMPSGLCKRWELVIDTDAPIDEDNPRIVAEGERTVIAGRSVAVFLRMAEEDDRRDDDPFSSLYYPTSSA